MSAHDDKGGGPRRHWRLAGGGLLLLLAALGLLYFRKAPRPTPQETPDENPATGGVASLRGWVEDEAGFRVAGARVLAFDSLTARGPASPCPSAGADSHLFSQSCPEAGAMLEHLVDAGGLVPRPLATATSDARGDFTLRMPGGSYHLLAEVRGRPVAVARELGPGLSRVRMAVTATVNLSGRVVDAAGGGVPRARVTVVALEPLRLLHELETDETGTFLVAGLLPQPRFGLWARAKKGPSGHAVAEVDAATQKVELVLGQPE
ncbi:carboxypeptidase-like regulatory domain-containing protein [Archangium gephyra]|uniref:carboxypeptidase-like regulatory domain-containing protein n=1 Tax=Archangium gephyra TaxID=48 RepID=UPI003B768DD6